MQIGGQSMQRDQNIYELDVT